MYGALGEMCKKGNGFVTRKPYRETLTRICLSGSNFALHPMHKQGLRSRYRSLG